MNAIVSQQTFLLREIEEGSMGNPGLICRLAWVRSPSILQKIITGFILGMVYHKPDGHRSVLQR